ncbi:MAG: LysR family transcriptional regulator [Pseudomonadota bacterium]
MRINYDLSDLDAFLAVKSTGSFRHAAEQLSLSQSAVTRKVQKLESVLDVVLFERTTRSIKPTLAAKRLEPRARALIEDAMQTIRAMRDDSVAFAHQRNLVITLACIPTVVGRLMPRALKHFRAAGENARIRFIDVSSNEVVDAVKEGDADFGISYLPGLDAQLEFETLFDDDLILVLPKGHALNEATDIGLEDLRNEHLIISARKTGNRMLIDDALSRLADQVHWTYETERSTTALTLTAAGAGLALLPRSLVQDTSHQVTWKPLSGVSISRPIGLIGLKGKSESKSIAVLKDAIRRTGAL